MQRFAMVKAEERRRSKRDDNRFIIKPIEELKSNPKCIDIEKQGTLIEGPPKDLITGLKFCKQDSTLLFATSLDRYLYIYNVVHSRIIKKIFGFTPLTCLVVLSDNFVCTGGADGRVRGHNIEAETTHTLGTNKGGITSLVCYGDDTVISGGLDGIIKFWSVKDVQPNTPVKEYRLGREIYAMDIKRSYLAVAQAERYISVFDVRKDENSIQIYKVSIDSSFSAISLSYCCQKLTYTTLNGTHGTISLKDKESNNSENEPIQGHYIKVSEMITSKIKIIPMASNCIIYYSKESKNKFITGGSDGLVKWWKEGKSKSLVTYPSYPTSISAMDISSDLKYLAIASSYTWDLGDIMHPKDNIFIRKLVKDKEEYANLRFKR